MTTKVTQHPSIESYYLESICRTIAATEDGLKGWEMKKILADVGIKDTDPFLTKWKRLYNAFTSSQNRRQCSNEVLKFLTHAMQPSRYFGKDKLFHSRLNELNQRLSFIGLELTKEAKYRKVEKSKTLLDLFYNRGTVKAIRK